MSAIEGRVCEVTAGIPSEIEGRRWSTVGNGAVRIAIAIRLTTSRKPNKAQVSMFNLGDDSVDFLSRPLAIMSLRAGYQQANDLIAAGDIAHVDDSWDGNTRTTVVTIGDGEVQLLNSRFDASYAGRITTVEILDDILAATTFGRGFIDPELSSRAYPNGAVFFGLAADALDLILGDVGAEWSIQNGSLQVLLNAAAPNFQTGVLFNVNSGMKSVQRVKKGIELVSYLNGQVWPGRPIQVESRKVSGSFVARTVEHSGDGFQASSKFETKIRAREIR